MKSSTVHVISVGPLGNDKTCSQVGYWDELDLVKVLDRAWGIDVYDPAKVASYTFEDLTTTVRCAVVSVKLAGGDMMHFSFFMA